MKRDSDLAWELIGQDPVLRLELIAIEQHMMTDDERVNELLNFYGKIERIILFAEVVLEDNVMSQ